MLRSGVDAPGHASRARVPCAATTGIRVIFVLIVARERQDILRTPRRGREGEHVRGEARVLRGHARSRPESAGRIVRGMPNSSRTEECGGGACERQFAIFRDPAAAARRRWRPPGVRWLGIRRARRGFRFHGGAARPREATAVEGRIRGKAEARGPIDRLFASVANHAERRIREEILSSGAAAGSVGVRAPENLATSSTVPCQLDVRGARQFLHNRSATVRLGVILSTRVKMTGNNNAQLLFSSGERRFR